MRIYTGVTIDTESENLRVLGYSGTINDKQFAALRAEGLLGALPDMFKQFDGELGVVDVTAPVITGTPLLTDNSIDVTGTLPMTFHYTNTSSATPPSASTIKAAPDSRSLSVGANSLTGLTQETTPGTWYFHYLVSNAAGDSPIETESYVISAPAIAYVGGKVFPFPDSTVDQAISLTDLTGGLAAAPSENDLVLIAYGIGAASDIDVALTTSGYTEIAELYQADGDNTNLAVFRKFMTATPDTSVTITQTGNAAWAGSVAIHVWRNVNQTTPLDVAHTTATGQNTGRPTPPAITPSTAGSVIVCAAAGASTNGADFTNTDLANFITEHTPDVYDVTIGMGSFAWVSGTFTPVQWGGNSNAATDSWCAVTLALRPA